MANVQFFYRATAEEHNGLERRNGDERRHQPRDTTDRREQVVEERDLLNRALIEFCDEVEARNGAITFKPVDDGIGEQILRKKRIPEETAARVAELISRHPEVNKEQFVREALRRWAAKRV